MDELEFLKNSWKKSQNNFPEYNKEELYKMLHKKSSSIVKWIFIVSILELVLISGLDVFLKNSGNDDAILHKFHLYYIIKTISYIHYAIIIGFVITFYKSFKRISVIDNLKKLMTNILFVKKITNLYVVYNITGMIITAIIFSIGAAIYDPIFADKAYKIDPFKLYLIYIIAITIVFTLLIGGYYLLYRLIYGRLIKKLADNYEELKKLDL